MIRAVLLVAGLALAIQASVASFGDTRYLARASRSIPDLLNPRGTSTGGVYLVMQTADCLRSGEFIAHWNASQAARRFPVTGLVIGNGPLTEEEATGLRENGVTFPLRRIAEHDATLVAHKLGYLATPFAIVLDRAGRVTASFPGKQEVPLDALVRLIGDQ